MAITSDVKKKSFRASGEGLLHAQSNQDIIGMVRKGPQKILEPSRGTMQIGGGVVRVD